MQCRIIVRIGGEVEVVLRPLLKIQGKQQSFLCREDVLKRRVGNPTLKQIDLCFTTVWSSQYQDLSVSVFHGSGYTRMVPPMVPDPFHFLDGLRPPCLGLGLRSRFRSLVSRQRCHYWYRNIRVEDTRPPREIYERPLHRVRKTAFVPEQGGAKSRESEEDPSHPLCAPSTFSGKTFVSPVFVRRRGRCRFLVPDPVTTDSPSEVTVPGFNMNVGWGERSRQGENCTWFHSRTNSRF